MHNQDQRVLNLPAGYFGMVLGTIGMGFAALCRYYLAGDALAGRDPGGAGGGDLVPAERGVSYPCGTVST